MGSDTLNETLDMVQRNDESLTKHGSPRRRQAVYAFFRDWDRCLGEIAGILASGGHCGIVLANRTVRRVTIPTDVITNELGRRHGLRVVDVIKRTIPNKVMPAANAPENITKSPGKTMTKESILILER